ncbi:MAG: hypothetical protein WB460_01915 [Candidatus Acidiferrales bacterium]
MKATKIIAAYSVPGLDVLVAFCPKCRGWRTYARGGRPANAPDFGIHFVHRRTWLLLNAGPATPAILRAIN